MGHRDVKRVPLDFQWPLKKVWSGYLRPAELDLPECPDCGGDGYTPEARAVANTFYAHMLWGPGMTVESMSHARALAWSDKIGQAEVDNLIAEGRLRTWNPRTRRWDAVPRTAAEVNASQRREFVHDAINRMILVRFRCERLGIPLYCGRCDGNGEIATPEVRRAHEEWEPTEPPTGEGWQLWETTTEGAPVSPVFADPAALADWCETNATWFADERMPAADWLRSFLEGTTDLATTVVMRR